MRTGLYTIYDAVANDTVGMVMTARAEAPAIRNFSDAVLMDGSHLARHPDDFMLIRIGHINTDHVDSDGPLFEEDRKIIITAAQIIQAQKPAPNAAGGQ